MGATRTFCQCGGHPLTIKSECSGYRAVSGFCPGSMVVVWYVEVCGGWLSAEVPRPAVCQQCACNYNRRANISTLCFSSRPPPSFSFMCTLDPARYTAVLQVAHQNRRSNRHSLARALLSNRYTAMCGPRGEKELTADQAPSSSSSGTPRTWSPSSKLECLRFFTHLYSASYDPFTNVESFPKRHHVYLLVALGDGYAGL